MSHDFDQGRQICRKKIWCAQRPARSEGKGHGGTISPHIPYNPGLLHAGSMDCDSYLTN